MLSLGADDWEERVRAAPFEGRIVFHLAARVHAPHECDETAFARDNVDKTVRLAREASRRGARRFIFVSSSKVYGDESHGRPFAVGDPLAPGDAYSRSKRDAEEALAREGGESGLAMIVVRPPLVMGAGARANVESAMRLADSGWPLPFATIANRRSFVHVSDLARLLLRCATGATERGTFDAAHAVPMSTPALFAALRRHLVRAPRLFAMPPEALERAASLAGMGSPIRRLTRSLEVDPAATERTLAWSAFVGLDEAAAEMARAWRAGWR